MAMNVNTTASFNLTAAINGAIALFGGSQGVNVPFPGQSNSSLQIGAGAGKFNFAYGNARAVTSGTPDTIDLTTTLIAVDGTTCNFADILLLMVFNHSNSGGNLTLGPSASNGWTHLLSGTSPLLTWLPGEGGVPVFGFVAVGPTVDSTHKSIDFNATAGTCTYDLLVLGH